MNKTLFEGKRVLELGCGQGLPGICALMQGKAAHVAFQDYNQEVIDKATKPTVILNYPESTNYSFYSGSWE
jgi:SAM-dependent methyltransferase